jgi:hypothetical protein
MQNIQHDRTRTKVKRHILADLCLWVAGDFQFCETPLFDSGQADDLAIQAQLDPFGV